jgi:exodeoxyribonuclease VII small subunit
MAKKKLTNEMPDFEASLESLEAIVESLEKGDLSLDDALAQYEKGVNLARSCGSALKNAEQRVKILINQHEKIVKDLEADEEEDDDE